MELGPEQNINMCIVEKLEEEDSFIPLSMFYKFLKYIGV